MIFEGARDMEDEPPRSSRMAIVVVIGLSALLATCALLPTRYGFGF